MKKKKLLAVLCAIAISMTSVLPTVAAGENQTDGTSESQGDIITVETKISFDSPEGLDKMTNIALGKPVISDPEITSTHPASDLTDGEYDSNANERGGSFVQLGDVPSGTQWNLTVDLGAVAEFHTIKIDKLNLGGSVSNNLQKYQMQISEDGETWKALGDIQQEDTSNDKAVYFTPLEEQTARYVRIYVPSESVGTGWKAVDELEVYVQGKAEEPEIDFRQYENIALKGKATMSEPEYTQQPHLASMINDGDPSTFAQASEGQAFDAVIDLNGTYTINTAVLKWYNISGLNQPNRVKAFDIYTSGDGETWNLAVSRTVGADEVRKDVVATFAPTEASYVKFVMTDYEPWMAVNELELYDTSKLPAVGTNFANGSTLKKGTQIQLSSNFDSDIYYTLDGSEPTTASTKYTEPIIAKDDLTIKAIAVKEGYKDSDVVTFTYPLQWIETSPDSGKVEKGTEVTFTCHLSDAKMFYTTDGTDPRTSDSRKEYKESIEIEEYTYLKVYAEAKEKTTPVYEFIYTTENIAERKAVKSSKGEFAKATDGDKDTMWAAGVNDWLKIDFEEFYDFGCVNILWADAEADYKYIIETSSDNYSWHTYASNPTGNNPAQEHVLPLQETHWRYMRIKLLGAKEGSTLGIREIEVAGKKSAEIPEIPMYDDESDLYDRVVVNPIPEKVKGVKNTKISLNGEWSFTMYPQNAFWQDDADLSDWDKAKIPGDLDAEGFAVYNMDDPNWHGGYGGAKFYPGNNVEMAYKTQIDVPADYDGQKVFLRVDKAFSYARVWVNGQFVREHRGEFNTWDADITDYIKPGQKNWITLAVTAEGSYDDEGQIISFVGLRSLRGVLGNVSMYTVPEVYLNRLHVETDLDEEYKDAELTIMTNTFFEEDKNAEIQLSLTDMNGKDVKLSKDTIKVGKKDNFKDKNITVKIKNPEKWDAEHPNLYTLKADVKVDGKTVETVSKRIGFREITIEDSVFKINGIPTKLRGVNYHSVYGNDGIAYDFETEKALLETAKKNNVNYIRAAHYPLSTETLELCDEMGIFVEQENSMCFGDPYNMKPNAHWHEFYKDYLLHACSEMVEKDRSHPSIVMWSIANESTWGDNHDKTSRYIKDVNPSIPVKFSWGDQVPAGAAVDIKSNHYKLNGGSAHGRPVVWDEFAHDYSHGNEAHMRFDPGLRENYYQIIKQNWEEIYRTDTALGGAIWCYTDNAYEGDNRVLGNSNWGQVDVWGREKPEIWATRNVYSPVQYKDEDAVATPNKKEELILHYENRYETVSFDDNDFEILYSVNGNKSQKAVSNIKPKTSGEVVLLPSEEGWKAGDTIQLEFYKTTNGIRRNVLTHVVTLGAPVYVFPEATGTAPEVTEDDTMIHVTGDTFAIDFSKETGKIVNGTKGDASILVGGPHLNLGMTDVGTWQLGSIQSEVKNGSVVITIDGSYSNNSIGGCTFTLTIDSVGRIETAYHIKNTGNINGFEIGVSYDVPQTAETLTWVRDGYLSYYPEEQMGRLTGTAVKEYADWKREWGVKPTKPWKEDDKDFYNFGVEDKGGRGTNDFRGSKTGMHYAELGFGDTENVLAVYGDGNGSVRAAINEDQTVRLNINNAWGYPVNGLSGIGGKNATAQADYSNVVVMQLSDKCNNYEVTYGNIPIPEFIKVDSVKSGSTYSESTSEQNIINNSGMSSDTKLEALHDNAGNAATMWHSQNNPGENAWLQFDLGKVYNLNQMFVWNHNQAGLEDRGLKNVKIEYSEDGIEWKELKTDMKFTDGEAEYPFQFAKATGENGMKATNLNDGKNTPITFGGEKARYVKITANQTPGNGTWGSSYYGLSEVRFTKMVDKSELESVIKMAEEKLKNQDKYEAEGIKALNECLQEAKALLKSDDATQEEVNSMIQKMVELLDNLQLKDEETKPGDSDTDTDVGKDDDKSDEGKKDDTTPKTGDSTNVVLQIVLTLLLGVTVVVIVKKRKK